MRLIIAGSRHIDKYRAFFETVKLLRSMEAIDAYVTGACPTGPDQVPYLLNALPTYVPIVEFPADRKTHGRRAGPIRNAEMAEYADGLLLIWDGVSRGSADMKRQMEKLNKPIWEVIING